MKRNDNLNSTVNKENEISYINQKKPLLKNHQTLNISSLYSNSHFRKDKYSSKSPLRHVSPLNTNTNLIKIQNLGAPKRSASMNGNTAEYELDEIDRFSVMKKRSSMSNFGRSKGKIAKQSIYSQNNKSSLSLSTNNNSLLSHSNLFYLNGGSVNQKYSLDTSSSDSDSLLYDQSPNFSNQIKANDIPEKQIKIMNEKIFKEQIKRICQDSNSESKDFYGAKQRMSNASSPDKIISEIVESSSPMKSPSRSPMRSPTREVSGSEFSNNDVLLMSYLKPKIELKKISKIPQRILDAPNFNSDITLTQISWSAKNVLAVVLANVVYLWYEATNETVVLKSNSKTVTCVCWCSDAIHLLIAYEDGKMELFDTHLNAKRREIISVPNAKIITADWYDTILAIGNSDGSVTIHDVSKKNHLLAKVQIKTENEDVFISKVLFNHVYKKLIVGCSNGLLNFYDFERLENLVLSFSDSQHHSENMIKAMQFNPVYLNILATGSFDVNYGYMNFYDIRKNKFIRKIETGVEITSINWNYNIHKEEFELALTCGAPNNSIAIYDYNSGFKIAEIHKAHTEKIVSGTMNNMNEVIATISAQENLSFFKIFDNRQRNVSSAVKRSKQTSPIHKPDNKEMWEKLEEQKAHSLQSPTRNLTIR